MEIVKSVGKNGLSFEIKFEDLEFFVREWIGIENVWVVVYFNYGKIIVEIKGIVFYMVFYVFF